MTLAELQALVMRQAVAKLDRMKDDLVEQNAKDPADRKKWFNPESLQDEIDDQELLIAKLTYNHEREQADLDRNMAAYSLARSLDLSRIDELAHLTEHRNAVLEAFKDGNEIQAAGLTAIADAIRGRAPQ